MKFFTVSIVFLAVIPHIYTQENFCPSDWKNNVCSCDESLVPEVTCEGISNGSQLQNSLRHTWKQNRFDEFVLKSSNISKLTDGIFDKLSFGAFRFENNNLNLVSRFAFKGSEETAHVLRFGNNDFSPAFDLKFLLPLRQLKTLHIINSNLKIIATGAFGTLPNLEVINVFNNNLSRLGKFAFSLLPKLLVINLTKNKLTKLEKNMFNTSHTQNYIELFLNFNEIQEVEADAFADLKARYVNLEHNKLTTLNQDAFEPLLDSMILLENSQLLVKGNPIVCDSALDWLTTKPDEYRHLVIGLSCFEATEKPQTITTQTPLENGKNCRYQTGSDQVQAYYQGTLLVNRSPIPHLGKIILRCSNVQNLKFVGNHVVQCVDGKFKEAMPDCLGLLPNSYSTAPPLWFTTYPPVYPLTTEEGTVVVPRGSAVSITCWWSVKKPEITLIGDAQYKSQKLARFNKASGWTTAFDFIDEVAHIKYTCTVPGSKPDENLSQDLHIKISDSCQMVESQIEKRGYSINPYSKKNVYVEEDRLDLSCAKPMATGSKYMTCKHKGRWEWGPEEDCETAKVQNIELAKTMYDVAPMRYRSGAVTNCTYFSRSPQVEAIYQGKTLESGTPVPHSGKVTFRCNNVQNMKFIGNHVLRCNDGRFTSALPECTGLLPNNYNSAPPLWVRTDPYDTLKMNEEGVFLIPRRSTIFVTCWWSRGKPDVTVSGDIQIRSQKPGIFNKVKGWVTEIAPVTDVTQIDYTCSVPESKPGGILTQEMQLKVTDTCQLSDSQLESFGLLIDPQSKKNIYEEEDNVYLLCGERVTKGILYTTCKSEGKWEWGPEFDCSK